MTLNPKFWFRQRTADEWVQRIQLCDDPRDAAKPLLSSNYTLEEKVKIQQGMTEKAVNDTTGMEWLEKQLETAGDFKLTQLVRWEMFRQKPEKNIRNSLGWCDDVVKADIEVRWLVQREIYLREELRAARKSIELSSNDNRAIKAARPDSYETELKELDGEYMKHCKWLWRLDRGSPTGSLNRGFRAWRKNPEWYLSDWLRQDCAGRGGCCGRNCGCCEKARDTERQHNRGHCTSACGCCIRTVNRNDDGKKTDMEDFPFDLKAETLNHHRRILRAYIWGLSLLDELLLV